VPGGPKAAGHLAPASSLAGDFRDATEAILGSVNPRDRLRSVGRRLTDPVEVVAQQVAERVIDLLVNALDMNALLARVDLNAVLSHINVDDLLMKVDLNSLIDRVDVSALLDRVDIDDIIRRVDVDAIFDRVDVNDLVQRIDMDALVEETDLGAVIARSSGGVASEALDAARSQAVGLDQFIDRWVGRLLRRKHPGPPAPAAMLAARAEP
jgi:hypothetical protein